MFGTMGFSEMIIILVIVLIIFGAGKLPQIGEGVGKALKGFKKEVNDIPPPDATVEQSDAAVAPAPIQSQPIAEMGQPVQPSTATTIPPVPKAPAPYTPGPELTPGTTAALMAAAGPQGPQAVQQAKPRVATVSPGQAAAGSAVAQSSHQPPTMEDRMATPAPRMRRSPCRFRPVPRVSRWPSGHRPSSIRMLWPVCRRLRLPCERKQPSLNQPDCLPRICRV